MKPDSHREWYNYWREVTARWRLRKTPAKMKEGASVNESASKTDQGASGRMEENPPRLPRLAGAPVEENQTGGFLGLDIGLLVIGVVVFFS